MLNVPKIAKKLDLSLFFIFDAPILDPFGLHSSILFRTLSACQAVAVVPPSPILKSIVHFDGPFLICHFNILEN